MNSQNNAIEKDWVNGLPVDPFALTWRKCTIPGDVSIESVKAHDPSNMASSHARVTCHSAHGKNTGSTVRIYGVDNTPGINGTHAGGYVVRISDKVFDLLDVSCTSFDQYGHAGFVVTTEENCPCGGTYSRTLEADNHPFDEGNGNVSYQGAVTLSIAPGAPHTHTEHVVIANNTSCCSPQAGWDYKDEGSTYFFPEGWYVVAGHSVYESGEVYDYGNWSKHPAAHLFPRRGWAGNIQSGLTSGWAQDLVYQRPSFSPHNGGDGCYCVRVRHSSSNGDPTYPKDWNNQNCKAVRIQTVDGTKGLCSRPLNSEVVIGSRLNANVYFIPTSSTFRNNIELRFREGVGAAPNARVEFMHDKVSFEIDTLDAQGNPTTTKYVLDDNGVGLARNKWHKLIFNVIPVFEGGVPVAWRCRFKIKEWSGGWVLKYSVYPTEHLNGTGNIYAVAFGDERSSTGSGTVYYKEFNAMLPATQAENETVDNGNSID